LESVSLMTEERGLRWCGLVVSKTDTDWIKQKKSKSEFIQRVFNKKFLDAPPTHKHAQKTTS